MLVLRYSVEVNILNVSQQLNRTNNLYRRTGWVLDKQQSAIFAHDGIRRRPTVGDYRTLQRSARRLAVWEVRNQGAALDPRPVAVGDQTADGRTLADGMEQTSGQLGGKVLRFGTCQDRTPFDYVAEFRYLLTYRVAQKTGPPAILSHCKYSENSMTELHGNWWTSAILYANTVINFLFFIALWSHLAKTPLPSFIHTVQIDLSITQ